MPRRFALYFSWSRPQEIGAELGKLENRYPTLFEFRRTIWPGYEWAAHPGQYKQGISGFLDHVVLFDFKHFSDVISEVTGNPVPLIQRQGDNGTIQLLNENFLKDIDTLIVVSLDHFATEQKPTVAEVEAIKSFLEREDACLLICPQHDVGSEDDQTSREVEFLHHGDRLVPAQQRIGGFARAILAELGFPIENQFGLNPAKSSKDSSPAPLLVFPELDDFKILQGVTTFNLHAHLPHYSVPDFLKESVRLLAKQPINPAASSHPFVEVGNHYFNALLWIPPSASRAANIFVCDATLWSSAFGGVQSLEVFWRNLAHLQS
ncbi:MAG: hypothetical protein N4J56_007743 [Chroococcidiopsis sp. SAG 2025]|uniref:hypothetical protein n=1 Tax=Chroococcidiopsis sp. SAG 2025 TaxID=171389 RepID=UPI002936F37D|nr:hypothetical protein [Chroococcidiopsis sp. SAG 2025]MDV2998038.1 hypothetical protein [Chroococcidiopsis sp. SAG 2025]